MATVAQRLTVVEADIVKIKARLTQIEADIAKVEADILTTIRKLSP